VLYVSVFRCAVDRHQLAAAVEIAYEALRISVDLSRSGVEELLAGFLVGALGVELGTQLKDPGELPVGCRTRLRIAQGSGRAWTAWSTPSGPMAICGDLDIPGSRQLSAYLLFIEWWNALNEYHALWSFCNPKRPTEWTIGRGRHCDPSPYTPAI
jgi:hypothetical protein